MSMDIEKLNKSQIVLLTLLVSFMTSIATGIVTVSLMQQAPPAITETVNRVIEHTVERVVPGQAASAAASTPEKTVVVKESDQIAGAIDAVSPSIVRLYSMTNASDTPAFLGLGVVIDNAGTIVTDATGISDASHTTVQLSGGLRVSGTVHSRDTITGLAYISGATSSPDGNPVEWKSATMAGADPSLGQTIILISGKSANKVGQGIVTSVSPLSDGIKNAAQVLETNLTKDGILYGSPIIDTDGNLLGVSTGASRASDESGFVSGSSIQSLMTTKKENLVSE